MSEPKWTEKQVLRYERNTALREIGVEGQQRLLGASALVVGAGGLGSAALFYLAASGVGRLGIVDAERVELSNLNRQVLHRTEDVGRCKTERAEEAIRALNPDCAVEPFPDSLSAANVRERLRGYDVVLDCTDNFPTRFLISDACWLEGKPLVSAAVQRFEGLLLAVIPGKGNPCYRCLVPEPQPPQGKGIFGAVPGVMGTLEAMEAMKMLLGIGEGLADRLLVYNGLKGTVRTVKRTCDPACPLCGERPTITDVS
ncbi:MAG TPA: HesA/MoeB/ThiF family protein [Phycisphaerae bacterium]|nr:HesA/MoeB/ThiF family protein [Phycisphaerae bacterium]